MSSRIYPEGSGTSQYSQWVGGILKFFRRSDNTEYIAYDPTNRRVTIAGVPRTKRFHIAVATVNSGSTLIAAEVGHAFRLIDVAMISVGGAAGAVTTVDIKGVQATSLVKLAAFAQASLTQSTVLYPGITGAAVLADGASFAPCDTNTALTIDITGSSITTATFIDVLLTYVVD